MPPQMNEQKTANMLSIVGQLCVYLNAEPTEPEFPSFGISWCEDHSKSIYVCFNEETEDLSVHYTNNWSYKEQAILKGVCADYGVTSMEEEEHAA